MIFSIGAMMTLAPKAVSLLPGLLRASVVAKLLFPGASTPGWLITAMGPIYSLLVYIVLVVPYQISGSGYFVAAMAGFIGAQLWLTRQGFRLARPEPMEEAVELIRKVRGGYIVLNTLGLVFVGAGMYDLLVQLDVPWRGMVSMLLALIANVLILTLIATDMLIASMHRAHQLASDPQWKPHQEAYAASISNFVEGSEATPPAPTTAPAGSEASPPAPAPAQPPDPNQW